MAGALAAAFALVLSAPAQSSLPATAVPLDSLAAFKAPAANWQLAASLGGDPRTEKQLTALAGTGVLVNNPTAEAKGDLFTSWEHGDLELDLDFLLTPGSNSGVYLMGRYEVQLFDSWGVTDPKFGDCGGIYQRWDPARGAGHEGYEGVPPRANASRAPGLWQHLRIEFRAPRFDAAGRKTANARFVKVVLNGFVIHEDVEVTGPTRGTAFTAEAPLGPLRIQGDHGSVALRALACKLFDPAAPPVRLESLTYKLYGAGPGDGFDPKPKSEGPIAALTLRDFEKAGRFNAVFNGTLVVPRDGTYALATEGRPGRVFIDDQPAVQSGSETVPLRLAAGPHAFRLDYVHAGWGRPNLRLTVEGPGLAPQLLSPETRPASAEARPRQLLIEPTADRVRLQRGFVPFDPKKRLYAINVGTPTSLHYAYDTETGAILRVWRGGFLDTFEMWDGRGENQFAKPTGPALTLPNQPVLALLERPAQDWPDQPDAMRSSQGYRLEPDGLPVFSFKLSSLSATDRIAPTPASHGFTRTLVVTGKTTSWESWVLLAEAAHITPQPGGRGYIIGDREYYLDLPAGSAVQPVLRTRNGHQQLAVPINGATLDKPIVYTLVW